MVGGGLSNSPERMHSNENNKSRDMGGWVKEEVEGK
jgi:hypothetical protein